MDRSYSPPKTGRRDFLAGFGAFLFPQGRTQATRGERDFRRPPHAGAKPDLPPAPIRFREIAAGDYDNDGHADLFVAGVYRNILYHNLGNGRFEDATEEAGIKSDKWSVAAGWFDYDNDSWLDLFVVNYAKWTPDYDRFCGDRERNIRVYCHPKYFDGLSNTLYRNRRDGTFEDVSAQAGIAQHIGRGMSVAFADYDNDGLMDVFVSNDNLPNFLFHNRGDGTFEEVG